MLLSSLGEDSCAARWACNHGDWRDGASGATLGGGVTLGGAHCGDIGARRGNTRGVSSVVGRRMRSGACGCEISTLWGCRGRRIDGLAGPGGGGAGDTVLRALVAVVVRREKRCGNMFWGDWGGTRLRHMLFEDGVKTFKLVEACFGELM